MKRHLLTLAAVVAIACLALPSEAQARRGFGFALITHGEDIADVGAVQQAEADDDRRVGFFHNEAGLFWVNVWTWGGGFCLYEGSSYSPLTNSEAASLLGITESQLSSPLWYRYPPGLLILIALLGIYALSAWSRHKTT